MAAVPDDVVDVGSLADEAAALDYPARFYKVPEEDVLRIDAGIDDGDLNGAAILGTCLGRGARSVDVADVVDARLDAVLKGFRSLDQIVCFFGSTYLMTWVVRDKESSKGRGQSEVVWCGVVWWSLGRLHTYPGW